MEQKRIKTRIIHKHATEANWKKAVNFIPLEAELIVYDPDEEHSIARFKFGDGVTKVNDLPFINETKLQNLLDGEGEKSLEQIHDTNSWDTSNEAVKKYVKNSIAGANNGLIVNGTVNGDTVTIPVGAFGKLSTMMNGKSQTIGGKSHAEGSKTIALENNAHAEGNETFAAGAHSHAEGNITSAIGNASHAEGGKTIAVGGFTHAEGYETEAIGNFSHAEGVFTKARGEQSHVEGNETETGDDAPNAHAEGYKTHALAFAAHTEGNETIASGLNSHAEGYNNVASGVNSHAEGSDNEAFSNNSHVEGWDNTIIENANYSHAEGVKNTIRGIISHAEGSGNLVHSNYAHAEGSNHDIGGMADYAHAEGIGNSADGYASHVEGGNNNAKGPYNHVSGFRNISDGEYQTVIGRANKEDASKAFIIGNGEINPDYSVTDSNRANAMSVDWQGNIEIAGTIKTKEIDNVDLAIGNLELRIGKHEVDTSTEIRRLDKKIETHMPELALVKGAKEYIEIDRKNIDFLKENIVQEGGTSIGTECYLFNKASADNPYKIKIQGKNETSVTNCIINGERYDFSQGE